MHLVDMLNLRPVPAAGLYLTLTRRCPLSCAHCSTNSMMSSEEHSEDIFLGFVKSFTPINRPDVIVLTGGEALVRPALVRQITEHAHAVGAKVILASGMFFARQPEVPRPIREAIADIDLFIASLDVFHEQQVSRAAVFRVLRELLDRGQDVCIQVVGLNANDPYLLEVIGDIRGFFEDRVPVMVAQVGAIGRAKAWLNQEEHRPDLHVEPMPCSTAGWPVVGFDGTVVGCRNQHVVDGPPPAHLRLGHTAVDDWATIRERHLTSTLMRAICVFGPEYIAEQYGSEKMTCDGYCATCAKLSDEPEIARQLEPVMARPTMRFIEEHW